MGNEKNNKKFSKVMPQEHFVDFSGIKCINIVQLIEQIKQFKSNSNTL